VGKLLPVAVEPEYSLGSVASLSFRQTLGAIGAAKCSHEDLLFSSLTSVSLLGFSDQDLQDVNHAIERKLRDINAGFYNPLDDDPHAPNLDFEINRHFFFSSPIGL
jgi:hypothetical protein